MRVTRQPGATPLGAELRRLLLDPGWQPVAEAELFLFLADRAQHVRACIAPWLAAGDWVLCDRYSDSTLAYQLAARKLAARGEDLLPMLRLAECGCQPDLTLWLDLPLVQAMHRAMARHQQDRLDAEHADFHQRVYHAFIALHQQYPQRINRIDASGSEAAVQQRIQQCLQTLLP